MYHKSRNLAIGFGLAYSSTGYLPPSRTLEFAQEHAQLLFSLVDARDSDNFGDIRAIATLPTCRTNLERLIVARKFAMHGEGDSPYYEVLGADSADPELFYIESPGGERLLDIIASRLVSDVQGHVSPNHLWAKLLHQGIRESADLHALNNLGDTPFMVLVAALSFPRNLRRAVQTWIQTLESAGVDLEEYGKLERAYFQAASRI